MISIDKALNNLRYIKGWFAYNDIYDQHDC